MLKAPFYGDKGEQLMTTSMIPVISDCSLNLQNQNLTMSNLLRSAALWSKTATKHKSGFSPYGTFKTLTRLDSSNDFESIKSAANMFMKLRRRNH